MERCSEWDSPRICTGTCFVCNIYKFNAKQSQIKIVFICRGCKTIQRNYRNKDVELLQEDLRKVEEWSKNSLLRFNEDKCVHMIISNGGSNCETRSNELYDKQLEPVGEEKDLGVIIDSKLSFDFRIFAKKRQIQPYSFSENIH